MKRNIINEAAFKSKKHYLLGTTLANADEDKFEDVVYDIWPDITGDIFSKSVVQIANRVPDEEIDGYLARLNEWGGAGFSYSSIFPTNRGGGMSRSGFGGANNLGGPNMMYTYEIKPLNRTLQPKPSNADNPEIVHNGNIIEGEELNKRDGEKHRGTVLRTERTTSDTIKFYVILDDKTHTKIKIDPTSVILLSGETYYEAPGQEGGISQDAADLIRAGQMSENKNYNMRAKFVNEEYNDGPLFDNVEEIEVVLIDKYGYDEEDAKYLVQDFISAGYGIEGVPLEDIADYIKKWDDKHSSYYKGTNESVNESMTKPVETTVDEFMTWYAGTPEWMDDWQTSNVMEVNGVHAQEDGEDGMTHLERLSDYKKNRITVYQNRFRPGDWELSFEIGNSEYSLQSGVRAFADEDDF